MTGRRDNDDDEFIVDDLDADVAAAYRQLSEAGGDDAAADRQSVTRQETTTDDNDEPDVGDDDTGEDTTARQREGRDDKGRFKPKGKAQDGRDDAGQQSADDTAAKAADEQPGSVDAPPTSWGVKAKTAWANLPVEVRTEIGKREREMGEGLSALRDYKDLKPYADTLRQMGGSVKQAMDHYTGVDRLLNRDLAGGLGIVAESYNKDRAAIGRMFADLAQRYGASVTPNPQPANGQQAQSGSDDPVAAALAPFLQPLLQEINDLKSQTTGRVEADRNAQVQSLASAIQSFAADPKNVYFANVEGDIANLFARGMVPNSGNPAKDLQTAYDMAIRLNPDISAALIEKQASDRLAAERQKEREKAGKARQASRSVGGSKMPGTIYSKEGAARSNSHDDVEADVLAAYRAHAS